MTLQQMIPAYGPDGLEPVEKLAVHQRGLRHPAISVFIMDGRWTLLQRRALGKYHTPGLWANACCTHPHWGEPVADCAHRRLGEELGISLPLTPRGQLEYRADVGAGLVEHEEINMFTAEVDRTTLRLAPNPDEVMDTRWVDLGTLREDIARDESAFTPWLRIYMAKHAPLIFGETA